MSKTEMPIKDPLDYDDGFDLNKLKKTININIPCDIDISIQVIMAIDRIMKSFESDLSPNGKDKQAIYEWFKARYNPNISLGLKYEEK